MVENPYSTPSANITPDSSSTGLPPKALDILLRTRGWTKFLAILWLIGAAFMVLAGIGMAFGLAKEIASTPGIGPAGSMLAKYGTFYGLFYIVLALLYIYPAMRMLGFSKSVRKLATSHSTQDLNRALDQHRKFWKFAGCMMIAMFIFWFVMIGFMGVAGVKAASSMPSGFPPVTTPMTPAP